MWLGGSQRRWAGRQGGRSEMSETMSCAPPSCSNTDTGNHQAPEDGVAWLILRSAVPQLLVSRTSRTAVLLSPPILALLIISALANRLPLSLPCFGVIHSNLPSFLLPSMNLARRPGPISACALTALPIVTSRPQLLTLFHLLPISSSRHLPTPPPQRHPPPHLAATSVTSLLLSWV